MPRPTSAWTKIALIARCARSYPQYRLVRRESPLTGLTSIRGQMNIRAATGIPRLNLKGERHGKPKDVRSHQTVRDLAYRQTVPRSTHLREHWNKRRRASRRVSRETDSRAPRDENLWHARVPLI